MQSLVPAMLANGLNEAVIYGQFVAEPDYRELPSGVIAASFSLTVRRDGQKTTSVPLCWFDPPDRLATWVLGERVVARGQVVRRFYRAGPSVGSATELVVEHAELARHPGKARKLLARSESAISMLVDQLAAETS